MSLYLYALSDPVGGLDYLGLVTQEWDAFPSIAAAWIAVAPHIPGAQKPMEDIIPNTTISTPGFSVGFGIEIPSFSISTHDLLSRRFLESSVSDYVESVLAAATSGINEQFRPKVVIRADVCDINDPPTFKDEPNPDVRIIFLDRINVMGFDAEFDVSDVRVKDKSSQALDILFDLTVNIDLDLRIFGTKIQLGGKSPIPFEKRIKAGDGREPTAIQLP